MLFYQMSDKYGISNNVTFVISELLKFSSNCQKHFVWTDIFWGLDCVLEYFIDYTKNALEHLILAIIIYVAICLILYRLYNRGYNLRYEYGFQGAKRVLFVTAHPDDECMFFGPTIYRLTKHTDCQVYLLCMSNGNKDGLGKQRANELWAAGDVLGIPESNIFLYKCTLLPDDPKARWRTDVVSKIILHYVESLDISTLVTFDKHGVSRHSNHSSIYYAVAYLSIEKRLPSYCTVYTLDSINLLRKYWLLFDMPVSFVLSTHRYLLRWEQKNQITAAMRQHKSQFVWFRRLYVKFSRYMLINTYQQLDMIDLELDLAIDD